MNTERIPPAMDLLRSCSSNDVLSSEPSTQAQTANSHLRLIKTTVINSQPQDFIVTKGQTYRVNRSPMCVSLRGKKPHLNSDGNGFASSPTESPENAKIKMLLKALDEANRKICDQNNDIQALHHNESKYQKRIHALEIKYGEELSVFPDVLVHPPVSIDRIDCSTLSVQSEDTKSADTPSRQRNKIQDALRNEKDLKIRTFSPALSHLNPFEDDMSDSKLRSYSEDTSDSSFGTPLMSNQSTPSSVDEQVNLLRSSHDVVLPADVSEDDGGILDHSPIKNDPDVHLDNMIMMDNVMKHPRVPTRKSALAARLGMSAKDRRNKDKEGLRPHVNSSMRKLKVSPQAITDPSIEIGCVAPYIWQKSASDSDSPSCTLFIAHDNPQLGKTVANAISDGMELMIESKSLDKKIAFLLAKIVYSGPVEKILISDGSTTSSASKTLPRGSQCLVCKDLRAYAFELSKDCETRVKGVIAEVNISKEQLPGRCTIDISTEPKLMSFFRTCDARVDVILSPHHTNTWYPYWEYGSEPTTAVANGVQPGVGARKMAPQFRSKGIGYLRLGDDMSRFGTSFLSCDAFESFMDEGKGGVEEKLSSTNFVKPGGGKGFRGDTLSNTDSKVSADNTSLDNAVSNVIVADKQLLDVVASLQSSDMKWSDRVACISQICDYLSKHVSIAKNESNIPGTIVGEVATCLIHQIMSQKNPLVLKEATRCVGIVGSHFSAQDVFHESSPEALAVVWTDLFTMCVHNLRHANRGVSEAAKASLTILVGSRSVNLKTVGLNVKDLIVGPLRPGSTNHFVSNAPNTARVLQWIIVILEDYAKRIIQTQIHAGDVNVVAFTGNYDSECPLGYVYNALEANPIISIAQCVVPLLNNKDVSVREAAVTVSAQLFSLDVLHLGKVKMLNLNTFSVGDKCGMVDNRSNLLPLPKDFDSLIDVLSEECKRLLSSSVEKKLQGKVVQRSIEYVNKLFGTSKTSDSFPDKNSPTTTGESPPSRNLKKSLSSLSNSKHRRQQKLRRSSSSSMSTEERGVTASTDPLADMLYEVKLSLKAPPCDEDSWQRFASVVC